MDEMEQHDSPSPDQQDQINPLLSTTEGLANLSFTYNGMRMLDGRRFYADTEPDMTTLITNLQAEPWTPAAPTVASLSPNTAAHGAGNTNVTLTGTNYYQSTVALVGGVPVPTTYLTATTIRITLTAAQLANAGTLVIKARNRVATDSVAGQNFTIT